MSNKKNRNSLVHGVYSSDVVLPWERAEDFQEVLEGARLYLQPNGTIEDDVVFEIAVLQWRKRRINRALQLAFLESNSGAEIEKSGKRSVSGIRSYLKAQGADQSRKEKQFTAAVVSLSESMSSLTRVADSKKLAGKLQTNLRSLIDAVEELRPAIASHLKTEEAKPQAAEKIAAGAYGLDSISQACEIEARLDGLIGRKIQGLAFLREFQRQYVGPDSLVKVIEHRPPHVQPPSSKPADGTTVPTAAKSGTTKSDIDDDRARGNDNDNGENCEPDPNQYDHEHEYDEALAERARRERG